MNWPRDGAIDCAEEGYIIIMLNLGVKVLQERVDPPTGGVCHLRLRTPDW